MHQTVCFATLLLGQNILEEFLNFLVTLIAIQALLFSKGLIKLFAVGVHVAIIQKGHETWDIRFQKVK